MGNWTPWQQGRLLITRRTEKWPQAEKDKINAEEQRMVFSDFYDEDEGRARRSIAFCPDRETAKQIVEEHNSLPTKDEQIRVMRARLKLDANLFSIERDMAANSLESLEKQMYEKIILEINTALSPASKTEVGK